MKTLMMTTAAMLMMTGTALAEMDWDANADNMIDENEFTEGFGGGMFDDYDADADGMISRDEYGAGVFRTYDEDRDGMWSQTEAGVWEDDALTSGREKDGNN